MLTKYVQYEEVRAVLGLSTTELPDATLALPMYETQLVLSLEGVGLAVPETYNTICEIGVDSRSADETRFYDLTRLYSAYAVARSLLTSQQQLTASRLTDGRAEFQRNVVSWEDIKDGIDQALTALGFRLNAALLVLVPTEEERASVIPVLTSAVGLATNPVTNV